MATYFLSSNKTLLLILSLIIGTSSHAASFEIAGKFGYAYVNVKNWKELKERQLVRQQWDISCGAAALSTLLTWYHDLPLSEKIVANALLRTTSIHRVRNRGGFSLLDLKRFVEAIGFNGEGYGKMTIEELNNMNQPAILPIDLYGLDHFVVYRGKVGNRFYFGDPAFGNISLTKKRFSEIWQSRIAFYVTSKQKKDFKNHAFHATEKSTSFNDLKKIDWGSHADFLPETRRSRVIIP